MKYLATIIIIFLSFFSFSQETFETLRTERYSIDYPATWELNQSGQMGMTFGLFSPVKAQGDQFRENVNLVIQDVSAQNMDLTDFVSLSEKQIRTMMVNGNILESEKQDDYHRIIYTGSMGMFRLKFQQHYWVIDGQAYVLTFTAEYDQFDDYMKIGRQILNSFRIK